LQASPAKIEDCVSRDIPAPGHPVSTGSIAILTTHSRLGIAQWAPWEVTAAIAIFSLGIESLRL
jgi:hypothetical protein